MENNALFIIIIFKSSRYQIEKVVNNQTSLNVLIKKSRNESGGTQNKHGSGGTTRSRIRGSALIENTLIEKPDCILGCWILT